MKLESVKTYSLPAYPTQDDVNSNPLLLKSEPARQNPLWDYGLSTALIIALQLSGCDNPGAAPVKQTTQSIQQVEADQLTTASTATSYPSQKNPLVAPVFLHGEGRGATGCVVIAPPVFLSEEDAITIIKEELAKNGIIPDHTNVLCEDTKTKVPEMGTVTRKTREGGYSFSSEIQYKDKPFTVDLTDSGKKIFIEFVSWKDSSIYDNPGYWSSVQVYDLVKLSQKIHSEIEQTSKDGIWVIFYDPMARLQRPAEKPAEQSYEEFHKTSMEMSQAQSKDLLRQQVRDFNQWLTAQKVM